MSEPIPSALQFSANYFRYSAPITGLLMRISQALGVIESARILPAVADELRSSARVGTVHYSNLIEGNMLPMLAAEQAIRGELPPDTRAKIELVNYVAALNLIDVRLDEGKLELTPSFLKELHGVAMKGLGREESEHFKPHHEGEWRDGIAVVFDHFTQKSVYVAPPKEEVPLRMESMLDWLNNKLASGEEPPFVLAGVIHYGITDIHPFADGNGRAARLFQAAILMANHVLPGRMFSFERYYADDKQAYYDALRSVRRNTFNMEVWLQYYLQGLAEEYERVAATIDDLSQFGAGHMTRHLRLTPSQQDGLTKLRIGGQRAFTTSEYRVAAAVSVKAARADLSTLVNEKILQIKKVGSETQYTFSGPAGIVKAGRPPKWTDWRIEQGLRELIQEHGSWPASDVFKAAGKYDLYQAASRRGGIKRWRNRLGA